MFDLTEYDKKFEENAENNEKYISEFEKWLIDKNLSKKTIKKHISNIDFYLNEFLNFYDASSMEEGIDSVYDFLGDFFINKCLWASATSIKENAASIKKFYECMSERGYVDESDYKELCKEIKDNMDTFLENLDDFDNMDIDW